MPDGRHLVYAIGDKRNMAMGLLDLDRLSWDTLAVLEGNLSPNVSADGVIAYVQGDKNRSDIYTLKPPSRTAVRLTNTPYRKWNPVWLPGGDLIYLTEDGSQKERYQVVRYSPKTGAQTMEFRSEQPIYSIAISRDGKRLAYTAKGKEKRKPIILAVKDIGPGGQAREIRLRPEEKVSAPSF